MEFLSSDNFTEKVLESPKPVIVEVMASWCHNCKAFDPVYEATAAENGEKAHFYKLNADDYMPLIKSYKVMSVPTLLYFRHGILVKKKSGTPSQGKIIKMLNPILDYTPEEAKENEHKGLIQRIFGK